MAFKWANFWVGFANRCRIWTSMAALGENIVRFDHLFINALGPCTQYILHILGKYIPPQPGTLVISLYSWIAGHLLGIRNLMVFWMAETRTESIIVCFHSFRSVCSAEPFVLIFISCHGKATSDGEHSQLFVNKPSQQRNIFEVEMMKELHPLSMLRWVVILWTSKWTKRKDFPWICHWRALWQ